MSLFTSVLIPLDGSKLAEEAIWAVEPQLAEAGDVLVVMTIDPAVRRHFEPIASAAGISVFDSVERYLADVVEQLQQKGINSRSRYTADPDAAEGVLQIARTESPTLVVMSSHGRSGLSKLVMGSVAGRVLRGASWPTLIVPSA